VAAPSSLRTVATQIRVPCIWLHVHVVINQLTVLASTLVLMVSLALPWLIS